MAEDADARDALFTWATDFSRDEAVAAQAPGHRPRSKRTVVAMFLIGGGCVAALTIVLAALTSPLSEESGAPVAAVPLSSTPPVPQVSASASATPSIVPDTCKELFSDAYAADLVAAGLRLDSGWSGSQDAGSADATLQRMLSEDAVLECFWVNEDDVESAGLLTLVAEVDATEEELTIAALTDLGYTEIRELGGVRFVGQLPSDNGFTTGESHFLRDGVWFATRWYGYGPYGYTADMVTQVFS